VTRALTIGQRTITDDSPAYVIAELGHNGQGHRGLTAQLIRAAAKAGASAVKFQKRDNGALFTRAAYDAPYSGNHSFGDTYGKHREALEYTGEDYRVLNLVAATTEARPDFFATAFDIPSANFLATLDVPAIKIASGCITDTPLLDHCASLGIPLIVSTGTANIEDVDRAVDTIGRHHDRFALLQCTAAYPVRSELLNLKVISEYRWRYPKTVVGLSIHTQNIRPALLAYALGARIFEYHVTLSRHMRGSDHAFSLEPDRLAALVMSLAEARAMLGDGVKRRFPEEEAAIGKMGKAIYAAHPLKTGQTLCYEDLAFKSPGIGLPPYRWPELVGRVLLRDLESDEPLTLDAVGEVAA